MSLRKKIEKIVLEMVDEKKLPEMKAEFMETILQEFKRKDGYFDKAWYEILNRSKENIVKEMVIEVLKEMPAEEKKKLLEGDKPESH